GPPEPVVIDFCIGLLHQDREGLYGSGLACIGRGSGSPLAGIEGPGPYEYTLLQYPLHTGASWYGNTRVEAVQQIELPAGRFTAFRIRTEIDHEGKHLTWLGWCARQGVVR